MPEKVELSQEQIKRFFANEYSFCLSENFIPLICIAERGDEYHIRTPLGNGLTFTGEHKRVLIEHLEMVIKVLNSGAQTRLIG